jgi:Flp pilus assembly protein TadB
MIAALVLLAVIYAVAAAVSHSVIIGVSVAAGYAVLRLSVGALRARRVRRAIEQGLL